MRIMNGGPLAVENSIVGRNTLSTAVVVTGETDLTWRYNDMSGNTGDFTGMADPRGTEGNLQVSPQFTYPGGYRLGAASPLIDAGDSTVLDVDGSRSDMGIYGGPNGSW